jgi:elongation factor P--(R)-beta-lysine ligase
MRDRLRKDPDLLETLKLRARIITAVRAFFVQRNFLEVTTPTLTPSADPALHLESFKTQLNCQNGATRDLFLPTSPEFHMKRMLSAGLDKIYQICSFYRNGETSQLHNPEFCGLEWYQTGQGYQECMDHTEQLIRTVTRAVWPDLKVLRDGQKYDLEPAFGRMSVHQALCDLGQIDMPERFEEPETRRALIAAGIKLAADDSFDDMINRAMIERVEPALVGRGPVFLYDYPAPMAALARLRPERPWLAERFELYIAGLELCNGYGELTDVVEQRARFEAQIEQRRKLNKAPVAIDQAFLDALVSGLPQCSGCALGIDRLVMLLANKPNIAQVIAFPTETELQ